MTEIKVEADTISLRAGMIESEANHDADWVVQWDVSAIKVRRHAASVFQEKKSPRLQHKMWNLWITIFRQLAANQWPTTVMIIIARKKEFRYIFLTLIIISPNLPENYSIYDPDEDDYNQLSFYQFLPVLYFGAAVFVFSSNNLLQ